MSNGAGDDGFRQPRVRALRPAPGGTCTNRLLTRTGWVEGEAKLKGRAWPERLDPCTAQQGGATKNERVAGAGRWFAALHRRIHEMRVLDVATVWETCRDGPLRPASGN